jgi:hypothetical protein
MFGCLWKLFSSILLILLGAYLHANWPSIRRELRERLPEVIPAPAAQNGRTVVWQVERDGGMTVVMAAPVRLVVAGRHLG